MSIADRADDSGDSFVENAVVTILQNSHHHGKLAVLLLCTQVLFGLTYLFVSFALFY
jgi:hypothetical protein